MKKIYMILAAMTLLSMSLNAQTLYEKVTSSDQLEIGSKYIFVYENGTSSYAMGALTSSGYGNATPVAVTLNGTTVTANGNVVPFTLGQGSSSSYYTFAFPNGTLLGGYRTGSYSYTYYFYEGGSYTNWRIYNSGTNYYAMNYQYDRYVKYYNSQFVLSNSSSATYAYLYVEASTDPVITTTSTAVTLKCQPGQSVNQTISVTGKNLTTDITATISRSGEFSVTPTSLGTTGGDLTVTYSPTAVGTHTATLTLSSTGADPVTITLNGTSSNDVTVCDGGASNSYLPVYGFYFDEAQTNQMLYPASMFTGKGLDNKTIKSITFYPTTSGNTSGINFYYNSSYGDGTVTLKLANMPSGTTGYDYTAVHKDPAGGFTTVKTITMPSTAQTSLTEWVFDNLEDDFVYNGGDLLIEVVTGGGQYANTYFAGESQSNYMGYYSYGSTSRGQQFLPKVTFAYEDTQPRHDLGITLSEPTAVLAGENATITATVTNNGNQTESGYTVTFSDGTNTFSTQTGGTLNPGDTETFTATYTTSAAGTVTITANVACTGDDDATNDNATTNLTVNAPVHDLGIALAVNPTSVEAGDNATLTATVTNNGNQTESGYTVTFSDGTNTFSTQTGGTLAPGATETFTATYTTSNQMGTSVTITANVACTGDADATNDNATASLSIISMPPPENVQATGGELSGTMTWDAPSTLPTTPVTEDFEDTSVFPPFEAGGVTATTHTGAFGEWTLYDATSGCVTYGSKQLNYENEGEPHAWFVFKPSEATADEDYPDAVPHAVHSGAQYLESICPRSSTTAAGVSDHWLISPELSGEAQTISFYVCELVTDYGAETYEIWVSTTDNDPSSFTKLGSTYTVNYTNWTEQTVQLAAGTKYFAIRHTSNDIFGLLIDDVTYQVPMEPESYNIYLDGVLVGNVDSDTFSYTFNNVSTGEHQCAVSAVYPNGKESVAVPATFTSTLTATLAISPATQTINDATAGTVTVTGTNVEGNISVSAGTDWSLNPTSLSSNGGDVSVTYTGRDLSATTTVTASATGAADATATVDYVADLYIVTDNGQTGNWDFNNGTDMSYNNGIYTATFTATADNTFILFARMLGNGVDWNTRYVFGPDSNRDWWLTGDSGSGNIDTNDDDPIKIVNAGTYTVTIDANNGTFTIERVPEGQTATPTIDYTVGDDYVTITASGDGTVTLNVPGLGSFSGDGEVSVTVPRGYVSNTINVTATAQESGKTESDPASAQITIPAGSGWTQMDGTYSAADLLSFKTGGEDIMLIDQFLASTLKNEHPDHYTYTLRQNINGETQTSNPVTIPVYKDSSTMQGCYTLSQIESDTDMHLQANVMNSEMGYDVDPDRNTIYHSLYRGNLNAAYPEITAQSRISQFQKYDEMVGDQVQYFYTENHYDGITPLYDHVGKEYVEILDIDYIEAEYQDSLAYVPVIWTNGLYTARGDGKNNSYGSDIKRENLGGVTASIAGQKSDYSSYGMWYDADSVRYCVYTPVITINGLTPLERYDHDGDHVTYEPYMYRAWCTYAGARDYKRNAQGVLVDNGEMPDTFLLGEVVTPYPQTTIGYPWETTMTERLPFAFGVPVDIEDQTDVTFIIRFYYKKTVVNNANNSKSAMREGNEQEEYYVVEVPGDAQTIVTLLDEMQLDGRVPVETMYYNTMGMQSDKPFDGINIVVTRYNDGTVSTRKVLR